MHAYLQPIIHFLHAHPHWGNFVAFLTAFVESLAIIGTVVPGSVTMTALGVLIGMGVLSPERTLFWIIFGAYLGDCLSYWFGRHYGQGLRRMWPFYKYPHWLAKGEEFFKSHGGKSVLIGRFTGPVRSVVPMIAGVLHMPALRFLPTALITAILWAIVYIIPGVILGAVSLELPPKIATQFLVICLILIAILWLMTWLIKLFFAQVWNQINRLLIKGWNYLNIHKTSHWLTQLLRNPKHDEDHQQLVRAVFAGVFFLLFLWFAISIANQGILTHLNISFYHLLQSIRMSSVDNFMITVSILGNKFVLLPLAAIIVIWLCWHHRWWTALHLGTLTVVSAAVIEIMKRLIYSARPPIVKISDHSSSFPSGHTVLSLTLFGFLAVIIADNLPSKHKSRPYIIAIILTVLVGISRIYLGAHWLSDIFGSVFLGMTLILITILSYRRKNLLPFSAVSLSILTVVMLFIVSVAYGYLNFKALKQTFTINWPVTTLIETDWWKQSPGSVHFYRLSRTGHPSQPLNIQWLGDLTPIEKSLQEHGWQTQTTQLNLNNTISAFIPGNKKPRLPLLPVLYHHRPPALMMTKINHDNNNLIVLRLWASDINIKEGQQREQPLWLGMINNYIPSARLLALPEKHTETFNAITNALIPDLTRFEWHLIEIPFQQRPEEMQHLQWDGKVLLIREK